MSIRILFTILFSLHLISQTTIAQQTEVLNQLSLEELTRLHKELENQANYQAAYPYTKRALEILKKRGQTKDSIYANWLYEKAYALEKTAQYKESLQTYAEAIKLEQQLKRDGSEQEAIIYGRMGKCYQEMSKLQEAEELFMKAIAQLEALKDIDHGYLANLYSLTGSLYRSIGEIKKAETYYKKAKKLFETIGDKESSAYGSYLGAIAKFYKTLGKYLEAESYYKKNVELKKKQFGNSHPKYARSMVNLASLYRQMGKYQEAEPLLIEAKLILEEKLGKDHPHYAIALNNIALLYIKMGQMSTAEQVLLQAKELYKKNFGKEHPRYLWCSNNLANLYLENNEMEKAKELYFEVEKLSLITFSQKHPFYTRVLNNIAIYYRTTEDYDKAMEYYQRAMRITEELFGKKHIDYALSLNNLAQLYAKKHNYKKAEALLLESKDITIKNYSEKHPESILAFSNLADVYIKLHQIKKAEYYALKAIRINAQIEKLPAKIDINWQEKLCKHQPISYINILEALQGLYKVERSRYQHNHKSVHLQRAQIIAQTALQLADQYRHRFTSDSDKLHLLERSVKWTYKAIQSTIEIAEKEKIKDFEARAFAFAEQNKSVLLSEAVQNDKAHVFGDLPDSLAQRERLLQEEYSNLQAELLDSKSEDEKLEVRSKMNDLNREIENFKQLLEENYPKYNALKYAKNQVSTEHIQELLDEETALIEYVVADSMIYIFCVDKTHFDLYQKKISSTDLSLQVKKLRKSLSNYRYIKDKPDEAAQLYKETAYWFYDNLVEPTIHHKNIKHLLIIPDGELGHLPFEAFLTKEVDETQNDYSQLPYLLYDFKISYDYSASLWDENEQSYEKVKYQEHKGLVLACAASYNSQDSSLAKSQNRSSNMRQLRKALGDLPAAKAEVEGLSQKFNGTFLYGKEVNESYFKAHAQEYEIIHLAMHGLLDDAHPILSSLAFTENGDSLEDNFLRAYEIAHLNLNAELVVLSACETGFGKFEEGEGVISLARSFMYAGVPSLVVSMWEVNDQSTARIMMLFYNRLADGMDKAEALQAAKIEYLKVATGIAAHPAFWAAFIQLGDHHPVHLRRKGSGLNRWWWFAIGFGSLMALSMGLKRLRRKSA